MIKETGAWLTSKFENHLFDSQVSQGVIDIFKEFQIGSFWDIGCGPGTYVQDLNKAGFYGHGIDGNPNCGSEICFVKDLSEPLEIERRDAAVCIEVGEHIPPQYEEVFISNLKKSFRHLLILSWAPPGQEGFGHFNCKPQAEVVKLFPELCLNTILTQQIRANCDHWYLAENLMVFNSL